MLTKVTIRIAVLAVRTSVDGMSSFARMPAT
jgi:hypothetical protein